VPQLIAEARGEGYDPAASEQARSLLPGLQIVDSIEDLLADVDAAVSADQWSGLPVHSLGRDRTEDAAATDYRPP